MELFSKLKKNNWEFVLPQQQLQKVNLNPLIINNKFFDG